MRISRVFALIITILFSEIAYSQATPKPDLRQLHTQASQCFERGDFAKSVELWELASELARKSGKPRSEISIHVNIAQAYHATGNVALAKQHFRTAEAAATKLGDEAVLEKLQATRAALGGENPLLPRKQNEAASAWARQQIEDLSNQLHGPDFPKLTAADWAKLAKFLDRFSGLRGGYLDRLFDRTMRTRLEAATKLSVSSDEEIRAQVVKSLSQTESELKDMTPRGNRLRIPNVASHNEILIEIYDIWTVLDSLEIKNFEDRKTLQNEDYTAKSFLASFGDDSFDLVHIASHANFSTNLDDTFILTYQDRIGPKRLEASVRKLAFRERPAELLVLSACETAVGDDRASLGLVGIAVKSGAHSVMASLWAVDDSATQALVQKFYLNFLQDAHALVSKARALQLAQLAVRKNKDWKHPQYWAPFTVIGNWLAPEERVRIYAELQAEKEAAKHQP